MIQRTDNIQLTRQRGLDDLDETVIEILLSDIEFHACYIYIHTYTI